MIRINENGLPQVYFDLRKNAILLNASEATNIVYRVKGLTREQANDINGFRNIMERCRSIKQFATSIEHEAYCSEIFRENLEILDSGMPKMLADLVKVHYFQQMLQPTEAKRNIGICEADTICSAVETLNKAELHASLGNDFCEMKFKRFLYACAIGMGSLKAWVERYDVTGGYVIVTPDGQLVTMSVYNAKSFKQYLYESTVFARTSMTRHKYLSLVPDGATDDYLLKLNLQIRFRK